VFFPCGVVTQNFVATGTRVVPATSVVNLSSNDRHLFGFREPTGTIQMEKLVAIQKRTKEQRADS
jgi:hypothetical protein